MRQSGANNNKSSFFPLALTGLIIFWVIYFCLAGWYISVKKSHDIDQVKKHATIIADDLWNLNDAGMQAYLNLAARADHYKSIDVLTNGGESFLKSDGPLPPRLDRILLRIGLMSTVNISLPVYYEGEKIGSWKGEKYLRYIYPLVSIFLVLFFLSLSLSFVFHLIFNRRLLEEQVKERTRKYHELVNLLPEMVLETDAAGIITFANENSKNRFGISNLEKSKPDCKEYIRLENGERGDSGIYLQPSKDKTLEKNEYRGRGIEGELFPVLVRSSAIYNNGQFTGARMVIIDITERKALVAQLNRDQKMKSIGLMAGGVAHDLNNILSGIINYPELMLQQLPKESPLVKQLKPMKEAGLRAAAIVADMLTVARGVAATKEIASLNNIVLDYIDSPEFRNLQSQYPDINYTTLLSPDTDSISCSVIHVRKCLMNLVINASESVKSKGHVSIATTNNTVEIPITTSQGSISPGSYAIISVKDSGAGISPQELSHIFEPFYSKKELGRSGTGLGLTVVWNTLQDHDGGIRITSKENGSTFDLYFPRSLESEQETSPAKSMNMFMGNGESILIVDDEFQQRDIASQLLESFGYNVKSVASGEDAVNYVRNTRVDLILLDMILDSEMNGLQTYQEIIKIHPGQKAIIMSGFSESDDVRNTIHLGAGRLVKKPYTKEQLARAVFNELVWNNS